MIDRDVNLDSYDYELPSSFIATEPLRDKSSAKLLVYEKASGCISHAHFSDFCQIIPTDMKLFCNDTKVLKSRIYGYKGSLDSNILREILFHRKMRDENSLFLCQIRGKIKTGDRIFLDAHYVIYVERLLDSGLRVVSFWKDDKKLTLLEVHTLLEKKGKIPLPPYIKREASARDELDYQSVFAKNVGAIAAPTASLHFSQSDFSLIQNLYKTYFGTLHVGAGTFANVESQDIRAHIMHTESFCIDKAIFDVLKNEENILCVGTTAARMLEYVYRTGVLSGECDLFLHPANPPRKVKYLLTNFHLPKSTLIMLIASLIGREETLRLYEIAKENSYRFYSYGDAMVIL